MEKVGERIDALLKEKGMSRKELSEASGITEAAICRYINGTRMPKTISLSAIAKAFDVSLDTLLGTSIDSNNDIEDAILLLARNAKKISSERKKYLINALIGD